MTPTVSLCRAVVAWDPWMHKHRDTRAQGCAQGCTQECTSTHGCVCTGMHTYVLSHSNTFPACWVCIQELRREILAWTEPYPSVQALAALLQGHDCILRVKLLLPHVFGRTCSEPHSLFLNNGRDVADSPHCSRSQQGFRAAFAQW